LIFVKYLEYIKIQGGEVKVLVPHLYLNGKCEEAITQYVKAFGAEVKVVIPYPQEEHKKGIMHSEIYIHGQRIMLNDNDFGPPELIVIYDNQEDLLSSYEVMKEGSQITYPIQRKDYSPCVAGFRDRFGVKWGFMVGGK
jgi:PhnB protein